MTPPKGTSHPVQFNTPSRGKLVPGFDGLSDSWQYLLRWASPGKIYNRIWRRLLIIVPSAFVLALLLIRLITPVYAVKMTVAPPLEGGSNSRSSSLMGLAGGGAAAALLGGTVTPASFLRFEDVYGSVRVSQKLIDKYHLDRRVFSRRWDSATQSWRRPNGVIGSAKLLFLSLLGFPSWAPPDAQDLAKYLTEHIFVKKDSTYGTVLLSYSNKNPELARDVVLLTYRETEALLIQDAKARYATNVAYLQGRLDQVTGTELRSALISLLADAERQRMLVASDGTYAAEVVDGPNVPAVPSRPYFLLVLIGAFVLSLLVVFGLETKRFSIQQQFRIPS